MNTTALRDFANDLRFNIYDLLRPVKPNARAMNDLPTRIFAALARPYQTQYVSPSLMTVSAVAYALRGYDVYWTPVRFNEKVPERDPAGVAYRVYRDSHGERHPTHGVELRCIFPREASLAEMRLRTKLRLLRRRFGL